MHEVRPFTRADRDQLTELVNAHIAAVVPGWSVSTAALLAQLELDPSQYVIDPWVVERQTVVAVCRDRIAAAAHLKRYGSDERVMPDYHNAAETRSRRRIHLRDGAAQRCATGQCSPLTGRRRAGWPIHGRSSDSEQSGSRPAGAGHDNDRTGCGVLPRLGRATSYTRQASGR